MMDDRYRPAIYIYQQLAAILPMFLAFCLFALTYMTSVGGISFAVLNFWVISCSQAILYL